MLLFVKNLFYKIKLLKLGFLRFDYVFKLVFIKLLKKDVLNWFFEIFFLEFEFGV